MLVVTTMPAPSLRFETRDLILRPLRLADAPDVFAYASSLRATRFMSFPRQTRLVEARDFAERCEHAWREGSAFTYAIDQRDGESCVGAAELRLSSPEQACLGYILREEFWGRGYATQAARALVDWGCAQPDVRRVWAACAVENLASANVLRKAGLALEARVEAGDARPQQGLDAGPSFVFARERAPSAAS
jgi:ribosomal-protein-alanine N-acetyltransferase